MNYDFYKDIADQVVEMAESPNASGVLCELCGSDEITTITYGLPAWINIDDDYAIDPRINSCINEKRIVLGGCAVNKDSPKYFCRNCLTKFGSM